MPMPPGASAARASRGSVSTASNDDDPTATGTAPAVPASPSTVAASSTTARVPASATSASAGSSSTPPLGQVVASSTGVPRASATTARRVGDGQPAEVAELPAGQRDEVRVGEGQCDDAAAARGRRQRVQPGARDSAPVPGTVPFGPRTA